MRVSYAWLRELLPQLTAAPEQVADRLTAAGLEVEAVHRFGAGLERIVVARVEGIEPHPSREQLRLVTVALGGATSERLVCGAANVPAPGGLVAVATEGTHLPALGVTLSRRKIGGVESAAMILSETEMGLADSSEGILVLDAGSAEAGTPFVDALPAAQDSIFEIGITPNRSDALGHIGIARELSALFDLPFALPELEPPKRVSSLDINELVRVDNLELARCPHYAAAVVDEVAIGPSPAWLRWRLQSLGIRPISNVVDITNLLLLEYGQPMHAFDYSLLRGARVVIRRANNDEPFMTLDGAERTLTEDDLVICDAEGPTALAGVMGGKNSEIAATTRRVLLECAYFEPRGIRRASRRHALQTESSYRFERGVDWALIPTVIEKAKVLLTELAGGAAVRDVIHARGKTPDVPTVTLRASRLSGLLGIDVPFDDAARVLGRLGLRVNRVEEAGADRVAIVSGASFRHDISREVDLIEEIARIRGLERIEPKLPAILPQPPASTGALQRRAAIEAMSLGLSEAVTYAFVSPKDLAAVRAPEPCVFLENPMSDERSVMRTSLLVGLFDVLRRARRHGERNVRVFTIATVFLPGASLPEERLSFAAVLAGHRPAYLQKPDDMDVYDAKGLAVELIERLTGRTPTIEQLGNTISHLHPRGAAAAIIEGVRVGTFGPVHPDVEEALDLDGSAQVVELNLAVIESLGAATPKYRPIPRLPAVTRDIAMLVDDRTRSSEIETALRDAAGELCESIELFDLFSGPGLSQGRRSLAYRLTYRDPRAATSPEQARTLTDADVDACQARVRDMARRFGEVRE